MRVLERLSPASDWLRGPGRSVTGSAIQVKGDVSIGAMEPA